jgi:hypothetical protein
MSEGSDQYADGLVSLDARSSRQRIALALRIIGAFPMTHHVECVAQLVR